VLLHTHKYKETSSSDDAGKMKQHLKILEIRKHEAITDEYLIQAKKELQYLLVFNVSSLIC
jgi:hypothetical protein